MKLDVCNIVNNGTDTESKKCNTASNKNWSLSHELNNEVTNDETLLLIKCNCKKE